MLEAQKTLEQINEVLQSTKHTASGKARETFDRSQDYEPVAADRLVNTISLLCHVEIGYFERPERSTFGPVRKKRLLEITGNRDQIEAASKIYGMLDDLLENRVTRQRDRNRLALQIDAHLRGLADK